MADVVRPSRRAPSAQLLRRVELTQSMLPEPVSDTGAASTAVTIRRAAEGDARLVFDFVSELAAYEKLAHEVDATEAALGAALFAEAPRVFCDIASRAAKPIGFALWFYSFSTFRGRHGIHLEDLYVRPAQRGSGAGLALLRELARRCQKEGLPRLEWSVLDWNAPALGFYRRIGAEPRHGWTVQRLDGDPLSRLAEIDG